MGGTQLVGIGASRLVGCALLAFVAATTLASSNAEMLTGALSTTDTRVTVQAQNDRLALPDTSQPVFISAGTGLPGPENVPGRYGRIPEL